MVAHQSGAVLARKRVRDAARNGRRDFGLLSEAIVLDDPTLVEGWETNSVLAVM